MAYQMRTKTKEECEAHYMKNFINNPLFASTLLSLRQVEEARAPDTAIPFKRKRPAAVSSLKLLITLESSEIRYIKCVIDNAAQIDLKLE